MSGSASMTALANQEQDASSTYRPDIEGLRAVAVLGVVLFHLGWRRLSGGFAGVDVFFVISGFVITRMVAEEIAHGQFSFGRFYRRRIFRIVPALLVTIAATTLATFVLFSPDRLMGCSRSAIGAILSFSNIVFWNEAGYFDVASDFKPLLHTWSLGIEEQFYLVWPALLFLASRDLSPRGKSRPLRVILLLSVMSLLAAEWFRHGAASLVFYWMPFRIFEFGAGAALVFLPRFERTALGNVALISGLAAIVLTFFTYDRLTPFPGLTALLPCIGAALAITGGQTRLGGWLLGNGVSTYFGRRSYALYLVHWPLVVFAKQRLSGTDSVLFMGWLFVATVVSAHLMHLMIEVPFRNWGRDEGGPQLRRGAVSIAALAVTLLVVSGLAATGHFEPLRVFDDRVLLSPAKTAAGQAKRYALYEARCKANGKDDCLEPRTGAYNVLIVGDSHAMDGFNAMQWRFPQFHYVFSGQPGCPPYAEIRKIVAPSHPDLVECEDVNRRRFAPESLKGIDLVVVSLMTGWFTPNLLEPYLEFVRTKSTAKVIVLGNYILLKRDVTDIIQAAHYRGNQSFEAEVESRFEGEGRFEELSQKHGFLFVSKQKALCRPTCLFVDENGVPFTWDSHHLSLEFAQRLGDAIEPVVREYIERGG